MALVIKRETFHTEIHSGHHVIMKAEVHLLATKQWSPGPEKERALGNICRAI